MESAGLKWLFMDEIIRVPLHVSGLWIPVRRGDLRSTGSLGAGVNLGLQAVLRGYVRGDCFIELNGERVLGGHADYICRRSGVRLGVIVYSPVGLGVGYGVSAASTLIHALMIGAVRGGETLEYAGLAHEAEVLYGTGLGDVIAEYYGGFEIRVAPGAPGVGRVMRVPVGDARLIACILPGSMPTPLMLRRIGPGVYDYGKELLRRLLDNPSLDRFFEYAQLFTRKIFDYSGIDNLLEDCRGLVRGFYRKKQALIIWPVEGGEGEVLRVLAGNGLKCIETGVDSGGVRVEYSPKSS